MSPALTYLFYDLETSGRNPAFDQILQFAAVRTDADFHELERHEFRIRLRPDVVPSPGALLVTGLNPFDCLTDGLTEYEAVCRMHELVNRPGTISVGYNSLTFDDLFLRFAFYRNLLPPYDHQFRNGCRRIDMFPITILYWLQESGVVEWPLVDGAPSLKLEHMNAANGLADGAAHDAMVDVLATLALARRLRGDGVVWAECQELFAEGKDAHSRRLESLPQGFALLIGTNFGYDRKFQVPVLRLGHQNGRHIWLQLDRPELQQINLHNITETAWISRTRAGEPPFVFPPKPHQLSEDRQQLLKENVNWLREHADILEAIRSHATEMPFTNAEAPDLDAALYANGFPDAQTKALCRRFHQLDLAGKVRLVSQFSDPVVPEQAVRLLARNYGVGTAHPAYTAYMQRVGDGARPLTDYRDKPRRTPQAALEKITALRANPLAAEDVAILDALEMYIRFLFDPVS